MQGSRRILTALAVALVAGAASAQGQLNIVCSVQAPWCAKRAAVKRGAEERRHRRGRRDGVAGSVFPDWPAGASGFHKRRARSARAT